jgi:sortase A
MIDRKGWYEKVKSRLPLIIIFVGLIILGIGIWQIADTDIQTSASLKKAKEVIARKPVNYSQNKDVKKTEKKVNLQVLVIL